MSTRIIAVDWSGAKSGSARKIALAEAHAGTLLRVEDGLTREAAVDRLIEYAREGSVVAGLDFGFSFPRWRMEELAFARAYDLWRWIAEPGRADDLLSACDYPFWGRPGRPKHVLRDEFRLTEGAFKAQKVRPKSVFQIGGAGAVGTGSIRGMCALHRLSEAGFSVWPFDDARTPMLVEIYPRTFYGDVVKRDLEKRLGYVQDAAGVPEHLREAASGTEDRFDAALSAIGMSLEAAALEALPAVNDQQLGIEGIIWWPGWREAHGL